MKPLADRDLSSLPPRLRFAFAPLVKRALGFAIGTAFGSVIFVLTVWTMFLPSEHDYIAILCQYFQGYSVSVKGAFIGLLWGFWTGFVTGWFMAFCRNFFVAAWIILIRAKAQLTANRDFLDHI